MKKHFALYSGRRRIASALAFATRALAVVFVAAAPLLPLRPLPLSSAGAAVSLTLPEVVDVGDQDVRRSLVAIADRLSPVQRRDLMDQYHAEIIAALPDLEAFARCAELAALLSAGDADRFVAALSYLTLDASDNWTAIVAGPLTRVRQRIHSLLPFVPGSRALLRFGSTGFAVNDRSNQAQHFWYSVAVAYRWGAGIARVGARYHEWNAPALLRWLPGTGKGLGHQGDLCLSDQGIDLGRRLAEGQVRPDQVADWLRLHLGPSGECGAQNA